MSEGVTFNAARDGTPVMSRPDACARKTRFKDERKAWDRLLEIRRTYPALNVVIYQCPHCRGWHFGNLPGRKRT